MSFPHFISNIQLFQILFFRSPLADFIFSIRPFLILFRPFVFPVIILFTFTSVYFAHSSVVHFLPSICFFPFILFRTFIFNSFYFHHSSFPHFTFSFRNFSILFFFHSSFSFFLHFATSIINFSFILSSLKLFYTS